MSVATNPANFIVQPFDFTDELDDRLEQAFIDVALRHLLPRNTDNIFDICDRHGGFLAVNSAVLAGRLSAVRIAKDASEK